ncbi:MAG: nucleoside deaminase [Ignavibacteria bacterium]|jgi:tRNA(Arg) A34 adenosine deaminase TadA
MTNSEKFMEAALKEAKISLREGNHGFGAVIVNDNEIISKAHDLEETVKDPTSHAEINAIKLASKIVGKNLSGCILVSTHEPCPMCSAAILWSGIDHIAYGYSIEEAIKQGRKRINLTCEELFARAGKEITVEKNILFDECSILYRSDVRSEIKHLRNVTTEKLKDFNADSINRRLEWFNKNKLEFDFITADSIDSAYRLLLCKFGIDSSEAQVVERSDDRVVFHSKNFCPTLEACKILDYDTRYICKYYNENSTDTLIKQIDSRLKFDRNYEKLRPYSDYCEEMIILKENEIKVK